MTQSDLQYIATGELCPLTNNPRKITKTDFDRLCDSLRANGWWTHRPAACELQDGAMVVLAGNQRLKAAKRIKMKAVPCIIYSDLTDEERNEIIFRDNISSGEFDFQQLTPDQIATVDFDSMGIELPDLPEFAPEEPKKKAKAEPQDEPTDTDNEDDIPEDKLEFYHNMLGDYLYDSDNRYEIPNLLMEQMPVHVELPLTAWGADARNKHGITTYHFYVEDYRFEKLFKDPINLLMSGCKQIVEPNCSIHDQTPVPMALFQIYKKRYLARYFQECGVKVWVDLNVAPKFAEYNMLGIPKGYNAFFTRGTEGFLHRLELNLQIAQEISGKERPNLCVYAGGSEIEHFCQEHGLLYITEFMSGRKDALKP